MEALGKTGVGDMRGLEEVIVFYIVSLPLSGSFPAAALFSFYLGRDICERLPPPQRPVRRLRRLVERVCGR